MDRPDGPPWHHSKAAANKGDRRGDFLPSVHRKLYVLRAKVNRQTDPLTWAQPAKLPFMVELSPAASPNRALPVQTAGELPPAPPASHVASGQSNLPSGAGGRTNPAPDLGGFQEALDAADAADRQEAVNAAVAADAADFNMVASRQRSYKISYASISNAAFYSLSASIYLAVVFALELRFPARIVFAPGDQWRNPFFYVTVIAWALLAFGVVFHCMVLAIGKRNEYLLYLPRAVRPAIVAGLFWVALGLLCAGLASVFIFLGVRARALRLRQGQQGDFFQENALPVIIGIVPAAFNLIMMGFTFLAAFRALSSVKTGSSRSSRSRSHNNSRADIGHPVEDGDARPFDNNSDLPSFTVTPAGENENSRPRQDTSGYSEPPPPPPIPTLADPTAANDGFRPPTRAEIDGMLENLKSMGFPSERENYAALYASNFHIQIATQRLLDAQQR